MSSKQQNLQSLYNASADASIEVITGAGANTVAINTLCDKGSGHTMQTRYSFP